MLNQTSYASFKKFGSVLNQLPIDIESYKKSSLFFSNKQINHFFSNDSEVFIKLKRGVILVVVCDNKDLNNIESFILNNIVKLNRNVFYNFISISNNSSADVYGQTLNNNVENLNTAYEYQEIVPSININKIYTKFYQEKPSNYIFKGEKHSFWELTFVDRGILYTDIDDEIFKLEQGDILFYAPNQYHNQYTNLKPCCYLTVSFDMDFYDIDLLSNKVFTCDKDLHNIVTSLIKELELNNTYSQELALCYIKELILKLLKSNFNYNKEKISLKINRHTDNELLNKILIFIDKNIDQPITVSILCDTFNISSSKLHSIFKENINTSVKLYINKLKLKKSRELMSHSDCTVGEVAFMLGFNSIHYFSNKFKKEYGFSPKEYINSINKN